MTPIFKAQCQSGKLTFSDREAFERYVRNLKDGPFEVIVRKARVQRSLSQNSYYHGIVVKLIADCCGYEPEDCHRALRARFLSEPGELGLARVKSTTELDTREFSDYVEQCRQLAAEFGVYIPDPGEVTA